MVKDLGAARKAMEVFPDGRIRVATLGGELVTGWGVLQTSGPLEGRGEGMLGRLQRMKELEKRIREFEKKTSEAEKKLQEMEAGRSALLETRGRVEKELAECEEKIGQAEKQQAKVQFEEEKAEEGIIRNAKERQKLLEEIEGGRDKLGDLRPKTEVLLERREQIEAISSQIQGEVDRLEEEERTKEERVHQLNLSMVRLRGEAKNLDYDIERSNGLIQEIENTIEQRSQEIEKAEGGIERYEEEAGRNEKALETDFSEKEIQENQQRRTSRYCYFGRYQRCHR